MRQMSIADASVYQGRYNKRGGDTDYMLNRVGDSGSSSGSTALYNHGSRFGLNAMGGGRTGGPDKMNGLHGPKHKRGDIDRAFLYAPKVRRIRVLIILITRTCSQPLRRHAVGGTPG